MGGLTWQPQTLPDNLAGSSVGFVTAYCVDGQIGWLGGGFAFKYTFSSIVHTKDGGNQWILQRTGGEPIVSAMFFSNAQKGWATGSDSYPAFARFTEVILHTQNGGSSWSFQFGYNNADLNSTFRAVHFVDSNYGAVVGDDGLILQTNNGGASWIERIKSTSQNLLAVCFFDEENGWAVGENGVILHTDSVAAIATDTSTSRLSQAYSLHQNHPNPFNAATTISFSLRRKSSLTLKVYNLHGEEVAILAAGEYLPGNHQAAWHAEHMASGVYFYRRQAENFIATPKMLRLR